MIKIDDYFLMIDILISIKFVEFYKKKKEKINKNSKKNLILINFIKFVKNFIFTKKFLI